MKLRTSKWLDIEDHKWKDIDPLKIKKGMTFVIFEANGDEDKPNTKVLYDEVLFAASDGYLNNNGIATVKIEV